MLASILFLLAALAQDAPPAELPQVELPEEDVESQALPAYVYTTEAVTLLRWLGNDTPAAQVDAGRRIEVIVEDGDMVRVRSGTDFGWINRDKLTVDAPEQP